MNKKTYTFLEVVMFKIPNKTKFQKYISKLFLCICTVYNKDVGI